MILTGSAEFYGIVGHPVQQVASPAIFNTRFNFANRNAVLLPMNVEKSGIGPLLEVFRHTSNFKGIIITLPYKEYVVDLLDDVSAISRHLNAVNTIFIKEGKLIGTMTDGQGMIDAISKENQTIKGKTVRVAGCGGAGRAIAWALAEHAASDIILQEAPSEISKAKHLRNILQLNFPDCHIDVGKIDRKTKPADILINATRLGMDHNDPMVFNQAEIGSAELVADVVTSLPNQLSKLLTCANAAGVQTVSGHAMAAGQSRLIESLFGIEY
jgi:shikimate dehydrogenase